MPAIRLDDGALLVPVHTDDGSRHLDGMVRVAPGEPGYAEHAPHAISEADSAALENPEANAAVLEDWRRRYASEHHRRSA